jgi:hypothetical protein
VTLSLVFSSCGKPAREPTKEQTDELEGHVP